MQAERNCLGPARSWQVRMVSDGPVLQALPELTTCFWWSSGIIFPQRTAVLQEFGEEHVRQENWVEVGPVYHRDV